MKTPSNTREHSNFDCGKYQQRPLHHHLSPHTYRPPGQCRLVPSTESSLLAGTMTCRRTGYPTRDDPLPTSSIRGRPNTDRALSSAFSTLAPGPTSPTAATPGHPLSRPSASSSRHGNSMAPVPRTGHTLMHRPALGRQQASASQLAQRSLYSCNPRHLIAATPIVNKQRKPPGFRWNPGGCARRRRDLNPRGAMHPYLLSREAHSTGLCDVSSADYFRAFLPRARTCARRSARGRSTGRRARDSNPRCHC